ncbi:MAG: UDP-N-acetylmuramoyl-L-alanyl-D-glutamate--2,6-diaminopimelate ligase [Myxococcota bacterium]|nr:UDP-N-acetylmuramoyl-L-alanyl-D-glutamate--2,6-diaminopimelate ligase [Myxococcota bacterium]MDW8362533.1 UDP-N-acetylmuramoyl-L-alanyl-D-glutamate--2,6-diaminopimelate ligase [Myxococcales bacterium]
MRLDALATELGARLDGSGTTWVRGVRHDSRAVQPGDAFVAVRGAVDGTQFVDDAVRHGAVAVIADRPLRAQVPVLVVSDARLALAHAAEIVYGRPTERLKVAGITGTNGKTTVSYLLEAMLEQAGHRVARLGTVGARLPDGRERDASLTTPEADDLARFCLEALEAGATHLVMEVSSHALALHRADGVRFRVGGFTNLTQDHLDFHGSFEAYAAAKARLFEALRTEAAALNVDDPFGAALARRVRMPVWTCSARGEPGARVRVFEARSGREGLRGRIQVPGGAIELVSPLIGSHNLENVCVATGCALALGVTPADVERALPRAVGAPGRLQRVGAPDESRLVLVDYAHTPDALARVLEAVRALTPGRLLCVFGCGGDRDRSKRPRMGEAAGRGADLCIVTSDNPRSEPPHAILDAIVPGLEQTGQPRLSERALGTASRGYVVVEDRAQAIGLAVAAAREGDTVLIAGKGHERWQIVGAERRPFDDVAVAAAALARGGAP